jgi:nitroimidazol reductase NimA-like FMN-containing flavoprotein (pyridoxamine 5'-phosphate oxidase superfamily)
MRPEAPHVRDLTAEEIDDLLERTHVARMAYGRLARVDIFPFHYVRAGHWLFGRTTPGSRIAHLRREWWVAVEVDEISGLFDWRSVVIHGGFYPLAPDSQPDAARYEAAIEALRELVPETLSQADPFPGRMLVFGVAIQERSGRVCNPGSRGRAVSQAESGRQFQNG